MPEPARTDPSTSPPEEAHQVASRLRQAADLLEQQGDNPFRVSAYRRAAEAVAELGAKLPEIVGREGLDGLVALPNIGTSIGRAILEILRRGRWSPLERLRGALDPERLFQTVPGIGPELARRVSGSTAPPPTDRISTA